MSWLFLVFGIEVFFLGFILAFSLIVGSNNLCFKGLGFVLEDGWFEGDLQGSECVERVKNSWVS